MIISVKGMYVIQSCSETLNEGVTTLLTCTSMSKSCHSAAFSHCCVSSTHRSMQSCSAICVSGVDHSTIANEENWTVYVSILHRHHQWSSGERCERRKPCNWPFSTAIRSARKKSHVKIMGNAVCVMQTTNIIDGFVGKWNSGER